MDKEEFERLKEAEKEHLRSIRKLKDTLRQVERRQRIQQALRDMGTEDLMSDLDASVERLALETLDAEARLSVAMEHARLDAPEELTAPEELDEEAIRAQKAKALVESLKNELNKDESASNPPDSVEPEAPGPEKTIGRMTRVERNQKGGSPSDSA